MIAWWRFDEPDGEPCADASRKANTASQEAGQGTGCYHVEGLFGRALSFSGQHLLRVPGRPDFQGQSKLSFSAWARPASFDHYNEIFRKEDGEQRVLFSFQENGTVLSLGLNIGGYVECDAKIDPLEVLDGQWHHCSATFDGQWMRVYLDGRQIGELNRPGPIIAGGSAPGCICSAGGGECFQGLMDDLRI
ncbi:MAG: LamG domain-containing protein, partial [Verrucomicrobia bacterium]|nr:LamG domain-containing protein [Verrucomicrobiota bacterium]